MTIAVENIDQSRGQIILLVRAFPLVSLGLHVPAFRLGDVSEMLEGEILTALITMAASYNREFVILVFLLEDDPFIVMARI